MGKKCKICQSTSDIFEYMDAKGFDCPRCGKFGITNLAIAIFERSTEPNKVPSVSYWIRQHQSKDGLAISVDLELMQIILDTPSILPKPKEQADKLILWMGETLTKPQQKTSIDMLSLTSIIGTYDTMNVYYVAEHLLNDQLINEEDINIHLVPKIFRAQLTFKGWERYYELQRSNKDSQIAFMAMQYDNNVLAQIFNNVIKPAVEKTGFDIRRLDEEKRAGLIDDKLRVEIRRSKFLISDLSDENNGAYWEAGYAEGLGMHVIYICEEEKFKHKETHFDTNHHLTVQWKNEPEALNKFAEELKSTIRATFPAEAKMED